MAAMNRLRKNISLLFVLSLLLIVGCKNDFDINNQKDFKVAINSVESGLTSKRQTKDLELSATLIPAAYQALTNYDHQDTTINLVEEELDYYSKSLSFTFKITSIKAQSVNPIFERLNSYQDYKNRVHDLNFRLEEMFHLDIGGERYPPALFHFEGNQGFDREVRFNLVFSPSSAEDGLFYSGDQVKLVFKDNEFGTGIHQFNFERESIKHFNEIDITQFLDL
ncbi:hypothetical protein [Halocola ammonii]